MAKFNIEMLILAREARGLSQEELAIKTGIAQGTLSKIEHGILEIGDNLDKISYTLNFPKAFFFQTGNRFEVNTHHYRKKSTIPKKDLQQAKAILDIIRRNIDKLLNSIEISDNNLPQWNVEENGSPTLYAQYIREYWRIPKGRLNNLTRFIEDNGIIIIHVDLPISSLDGLSMYTESNQAIIFLNKNLSGDRMRFTLAHELGHLGMHFAQILNSIRDAEKEAHEFASEILLPSSEIITQLSKLNLEKLADLKRYWQISMGAILEKAKNLKTITDSTYRYLRSSLIKNGYHLQEPESLNVPVEKTTLLKEIITTFIEELDYSEQELAELLTLNTEDFEKIYLQPKMRLRVIKR